MRIPFMVIPRYMNRNNHLDYFRALLIALVILIHIVNFGQHFPLVKNAILTFLMPTFLVITGFLVNVHKPAKTYARYIAKIVLAYAIMVSGFAVMSLYLPVRDGLSEASWTALAQVLFVKSIGPYWFLHLMVVCGTLYYVAFHANAKLGSVAKLSIFATLIILMSQLTPLLNIRFAAYYFVGVVIRQFTADFSNVYKASLWAVIPFLLLVGTPAFQDWATLSVLASVFCFFAFTAKLYAFLGDKPREVLHYIGRNTFPIYIFHPIFTMLAKFILPAFSFEPTGLLHAAVSVVMGIVGSIYLARVLDYTHISLIFGRKRLMR